MFWDFVSTWAGDAEQPSGHRIDDAGYDATVTWIQIVDAHGTTACCSTITAVRTELHKAATIDT